MKFVQSVRCWRILVVCLLTMVLGLASFWGDTRMGTVYAQDTAEDGTETVDDDVDGKEEETESGNKEESSENEDAKEETEGNHTEDTEKESDGKTPEDTDNVEQEEVPEIIPPEVKITIETDAGWFKDTAMVKVRAEDILNTGNFVIKSVKAKISQNGNWTDITESMEFSVSENCSVYIMVTDQNGQTYERNRYISCFDKTKPVLNAAVNSGLLSIEAKDSESGIKAVYVNGYEFTELTNGVLNIRLQQFDTGYEHFTIQAMDRAGNVSDVYRTANPYYKNPETEKEEEKKEETKLPENAKPTNPTDAKADVTDYKVSGEKEFFTIQTASEKVFYLIVDRSGEEEVVYFLTEISERDLLNVTTDNSVTLPMNSAIVESAIPDNTPKEESDKTAENAESTESTEISTEEKDISEQKPVPQEDSTSVYIVMAVVGVVAVGLGYYFKVVKKKDDYEEDEEEFEDEVYENEDETENDDDFFDSQEGM